MAAPKAFTEYNDGTTMWGQAHWWRVLYNGIWSSGAQHAYVVDYNGITEKLYMQIDGVTKAQRLGRRISNGPIRGAATIFLVLPGRAPTIRSWPFGTVLGASGRLR